MQIKADSVEEYLANVPEERKEAFAKLRKTIVENLPSGFQECLSYGMVGYVIPKSIYPDGYHCDPSLPLPFMSIASQKNFVALYHSGIYADPDLLKWWQQEYPKHVKTKLDMGKSCVRFKNVKHIPYELIAELCEKMTPEDFINIYETNLQKK
ncbi:DUF1801 domain-containing protein [Mesonia mobilis]|uniref:YdhG-like domain-containing protein n=1 Tax=Mesonia mobilis TaxID=369791 RepID=A0ABQ3BH80_9FLAO|nr:DUF1801 domain-containing protein [Mesonia mobilis]MBQ0738403.1 DUF1801 domain-containing protein [Aquimarina celericrescens]GGZ44169.1 hypothetical protein GCM10008088_01450 [Mesonia mobilis]